MGIQVEWADQSQTIVHQIFTGSWTWEEFYSATQQSKQMVASAERIVHIVSDLRESESLPLGGALTHARNSLGHMPSNWGVLVIVTRNAFIRAMVTTFTALFKTSLGNKTFSASTLEEAYAIAERYERQQIAAPNR